MFKNTKNKTKRKSLKMALEKQEKELSGNEGLFSVKKKTNFQINISGKGSISAKKHHISMKEPCLRKEISKNHFFFSNKSNEFFIKQTFEEYVGLAHSDKKKLGRSYFWITQFVQLSRVIKTILKRSFKFGIVFSYRMAAIFMIAFLIYGFFPGALSAPDFLVITKKAEFDLGTLENVNTETSGAEIDSVQLNPTGSWEARVWANPPDIISYGHSSEMVGNYLYVLRGYSDNAFWRYDTINNNWEEMEDLPQPATYGADMAHIASQGKIYAMFGGYSKSFYSYDIEENEWTKLEDLKDTIYNGASMESDGESIYVIRGNASVAFWKYDASEELPSWDTIDVIPGGATVNTGGNLVYGHDGYLYLIRGSNTLNFYRYDLDDGSWDTSIASLPATGCTGGGGQCYMNGEQKGTYWTNGTAKFLYFFRSGGTANFLRYQITCNDGTTGTCPGQKNTWTIPSATEAIPIVTNNTSLSYNNNDGLIYAFRSNGYSDLWKYDPTRTDGQRWVGPKQAQADNGTLRTLGTGSDLIWDGNDYVYTIQGNSTANVNRYQISNNDWADCTALGANLSTDIKGTYNDGNIYYLRPASTSVYYSNCTGAWSAMANLLPYAPGNGGSIVYNSGDSRYYVLRAGGNAQLYYSNGGAWGTASGGTISVSDGGTTVNYLPNTGARMVSNGTNLYMMPGSGETAFLRYNTAPLEDNWTKLAPTPFAQYLGTDMTYNSANHKIYALAGFYKDETWEFDTTNEAAGWRRLPDNQKYVFGRGPYNGASIEYVGNHSLYASSGQGTSDIWNFNIDSAHNYETSGTYTSHSIDLTDVDSWISLEASYIEPANTQITYRTMTSADGETWPGSWDAVAEVSKVGGVFTGTIEGGSENRYLKVRAILTTSDGTYTPTLKDFRISYNNSDTPPDNPTISGFSQQSGGAPITSGGEYPYEHPYFTWNQPDSNDSGIAGYWVCFGKSDSCNDPETDGVFLESTYYLVNEVMEYDDEEEFGTYYLKIKSQDNNDNIATDEISSFTFKYTGVSPYQTASKTSQEDFNAGTTSDASVISSGDGAVRLASANGFWNQAQLSLQNLSVNVGAELAKGTCRGSADHCLYTFRGSAGTTTMIYYTIETDTWLTKAKPVPAAIGAGGSLTEGPEGYLYAIRGGTNSDFWMYDIANDEWITLEGVTAQVNYGSHLSYDGSRYVYLMPGNDNMLLKFDTCNGVVGNCTQRWTSLEDANFDNPNPSDGQKLYEGADGAYDGRNNIFVTQGWYYPYFAKYSIADDIEHGETANTWKVLSQAPTGFYNGGCLTYDNETDSVFALAGNARMKFFKYSVESDQWIELPDAPATISSSASMVVHDGYIYIQRGGGTTNFYRFNIEENSWELPNRGFFGPSTITGTYTSPYGSYYPYTTGTYIVDDGNENIYSVRGGYDNTFGRYNANEGTFTDLARLPVGAYNGANMVYVGNKGAQGRIYYTPGIVPTTRSSTGPTALHNNYFYRYDIATNIWTEISATRPSHPTASQIGAGSSMVYDGSQYIYLTRGASSGTWWRFDVANESWSAALPTATLDQRAGAKMVYVDNGANDKIYTLRGGGQTNFYVCDVTQLPGSNCWSAVPNSPTLGINTGGSLMDGGDGYLYAVRGNNSKDYYRWPKTGGSWETTPTIPNAPVLVTTGGSGTNLGARNWTTAGYTAGGTNNVYPDGLYSYVVGSSSAGIGFSKTGTYTSAVINTGGVYEWANLSASYTLPDNTYVSVETRTTDDETICDDALCENRVWSTWTVVGNIHTDGDMHTMKINSSTDEYIQVRFNFTSSDRIYSPVLSDFTVNYYQDISVPENPTEVKAYDSSEKTNELSSAVWYNNATPYFEWPAADTAGGAVDNPGGSGIAGYYVCFGNTEDCFDPLIDGDFQTENNFSGSLAAPGNDYTLKIKAVDNAGMFPGSNNEDFTYWFDDAPPTNPTDIDADPISFSSVDSFTFTWPNDASDAHSLVAKFQYRTGGDEEGVWYDINNPEAVSQSVAPYQPNQNIFYLRTVDNADNPSDPILGYYYYSGGAASPPTALEVNPSDKNNATNEFTFTWDLPLNYGGDPSKIKYFYSVNYLPTPFNTVETTARAAGPGPFATQFNENTFYIVAMSEGGSKSNPSDVDWDHPVSVKFYARTTAPSPPINIQVFDTSDREAQEYSVAIKWGVPLSYNVGNFAGYTIYRSLDGLNFTEVATTTGTAYVDTELNSVMHYYYVRSRDKTNNLSTETSTPSITPTGRYTTAPTIVAEPAVSVESFAATITWSTNREASSFIEYGTSMSLGKTNGQVDSVTAHEVSLSGLEAATKYYYKVKYIDPDGNIGTSEIGNFTTNDPPTIADVLVDGIGLSGATVSWTTNMSGTCTLKYGEGSFSNSIEEASGGTTHIQKLTALKSATQYLYQVECLDADSNLFNSDQYAFTTLEQPRVENFTVQNKENVDIPTIEIAYTTTHPTTTLVKFKGAGESNYHNYLISEYATEHKATIEDLDPAIEYEVIASGIDAAGVEAATLSSKVTTLTDSRPPGISTNRATGRVIGLGKDSRANLYVKIETDESTRVKVLFGKGIILSNFEQSTQENPPNTYHLITIPVDPGQVYSYVLEAVDAADNKTVSKPATIVVEGAKENATEIVVNTFSDKFGWISKLWSTK